MAKKGVDELSDREREIVRKHVGEGLEIKDVHVEDGRIVVLTERYLTIVQLRTDGRVDSVRSVLVSENNANGVEMETVDMEHELTKPLILFGVLLLSFGVISLSVILVNNKFPLFTSIFSVIVGGIGVGMFIFGDMLREKRKQISIYTKGGGENFVVDFPEDIKAAFTREIFDNIETPSEDE